MSATDDALPDREFAAVVLTGDSSTASPELRQSVDVVRRRVSALRSAGVHVALAGDVLRDCRLEAGNSPAGSGRLLRAIGPCATPTLLRQLAELGVGPGLVLLIGDAFPDSRRAVRMPAHPELVAPALDALLARLRQGRVPDIDDDPEWVLYADTGDARLQRVTESLFTLAGGGIGTRGSVEEQQPGSTPLVLAAGAYTGRGPDQHLLPAPDWTRLEVADGLRSGRLAFDMRTGLLVHEETPSTGTALRSARFACVTVPGAVALRAEAADGRLRLGPCLQSPNTDGRRMRRTGLRHTLVVTGDEAAVAASGVQTTRAHAGRRIVERLAGVSTAAHADAAAQRADRILDAERQLGFDAALAEQRAAWACRWRAVDVRIPDDPDAQLAIRFALFHLWAHTTRADELALGARGLTGSGYSGHVFWDSDVFVLPAMATIDPHTADAIVQYRLNRLPAARHRAVDQGRRGARFPWESARSGADVTPTSGELGGTRVPILTGSREEHITADVAWAADFAAEWSGVPLIANAPTAALVTESARYWASRCRFDTQGRAHIDAVIGPDEYHEDVSDNAYTNVLARWNLRRGAALLGPESVEARAWLTTADHLVDGYDAATGCYEQFRGYFELESLTMTDVGPPPVAADVLLGIERISASQIIKQPDVLMLHHLVPDEVAPGSLLPNLDLYLPRTAHGSSLSPSISATLLARADRADEALELFRIASTLDLDDRTGATAAGLHMANLGGVWQCVLFGFAGIAVRNGVLYIDPHLPSPWPHLEVRFRALGRRFRAHITNAELRLAADGPACVRFRGHPLQKVDAAAPLCMPMEV